MMTLGEKVVAVGVLAVMNLSMLVASAYLAAGSIIATLPLAVTIVHQ